MVNAHKFAEISISERKSRSLNSKDIAEVLNVWSRHGVKIVTCIMDFVKPKITDAMSLFRHML